MTRNHGDRDRAITRILVIILVANLAVAVAKILYGFSVNSLSIRADGFHSLFDALNNVVALFVMHAAARPPDEGHPYGHRKFEVLASLGIGVVIGFVALRIGYSAILALAEDRKFTVDAGAPAVLIFTLVVNVIVAVLENRAGRRLKSSLLIADARHTLSDVFVTLTVLVGIVGSYLGYNKADALAALAVLVLIGFVGYGIVRHSIAALLDEVAVPPDQIAAIVNAIDGVQSTQRIRSRGLEGEIRVDLIVNVDPNMSVQRAHSIADQVEDALQKRWPDMTDVIVHIEPGVHEKETTNER